MNPKQFYLIGKASKITGVPAHVLRYWEKEFSYLEPVRDYTGDRLYTQKDIEKINRLKTLIYKEGYKIHGAKKRLRMENSDKKTQMPQTITFLKKLRKEIKEMDKCLQ